MTGGLLWRHEFIRNEIIVIGLLFENTVEIIDDDDEWNFSAKIDFFHYQAMI